ncbi:MAG: GspMb/PilO family protein [Gemmatimonadales bacterium]
MKLPTMSAGDRRALTLGAAILVPSLFFVFAVKPYLAALADVQQQLAVERDAFARERAAVLTARKNPLMQHTADSAMQAMAPRLFAGPDDVMASAEVATYLGDVARASHVWLQDASTRPATALDGGVRALHVEIRGESDLRGILEFVTTLESGSRFIRVQRLDVSSQPGRSDQPGAETLSLSASIVGYAIPDQAAGANTASGKSPAPSQKEAP